MPAKPNSDHSLELLQRLDLGWHRCPDLGSGQGLRGSQASEGFFEASKQCNPWHNKTITRGPWYASLNLLTYISLDSNHLYTLTFSVRFFHVSSTRLHVVCWFHLLGCEDQDVIKNNQKQSTNHPAQVDWSSLSAPLWPLLWVCSPRFPLDAWPAPAAPAAPGAPGAGGATGARCPPKAGGRTWHCSGARPEQVDLAENDHSMLRRLGRTQGNPMSM